jgi:hypothetical protein
MTTLTSCFALAPANANRPIHILFSVINHSLGNGKTLLKTLLHNVRISQLDLTYVEKAGMKTQSSKTDVNISAHSMSQQVLYVIYTLFPLKVIL